MSGSRAYLDHNATSPLRPEARQAVRAALDIGGNASAVYAEGRAARGAIEAARSEIAALVGADPRHVVFTSSASEAAAHVLVPNLRIGAGEGARRLIVSAIEHSAILSGGRFLPEDVVICPVNRDGIADMAALAGLLGADPRPALVALMQANNETGIVQPVREAADLVHRHGGLLVCDAVQGLGKLDFDMATLGADALILSGHKVGAPQGVGALVFAREPTLLPLLKGGGQENRRRAGTENLAGIAGFGAAAAVLRREGAAERARVQTLRDWMEARLVAISSKVAILGAGAPRLPNTSLVTIEGSTAETAVIAFDLAGVAVASGSACASGKVARSHVLAAMGIAPDVANTALRISLGWSTVDADVERFLNVFTAHAARVLARGGRAA